MPDSTWEFVDRTQKLIEKGRNNVPLINDFNLTDSSGADVTEQTLNESGTYYLLYLQGLDDHSTKWVDEFKLIVDRAAKPVYVVSSQRGVISKFLSAHDIVVDGIYSLDATAIKTAARSTPTLYEMKGPVVMKKWGWADFDDVTPQ